MVCVFTGSGHAVVASCAPARDPGVTEFRWNPPVRRVARFAWLVGRYVRPGFTGRRLAVVACRTA